MRPDQIQRLTELSEDLADVFITEADPVNWSGHGVMPQDMTKEDRGNRHWDRKGAMGTGGVLRTTLDLIAHHNGVPFYADDGDLDSKIADAEKRAQAAVKRVLNKAAGNEFTRRVAHGKARS